MTLILDVQRPQYPAANCVKCQQAHHSNQHRVICNQQVSIFANATPVFNKPYGTEEIKLKDGWFYVSLHTPLKAVVATLEKGELPWLCPRCAGYKGASNFVAPGATLLDERGRQLAAPPSALYQKHRDDQQALIA